MFNPAALAVIFIVSAYFLFWESRHQEKLGVVTFLLGLQVIFQFILVEMDIYGISVRIYGIGLLTGLMLLKCLLLRERLFRGNLSLPLFSFGSMYVVWLLVAATAREELGGDELFKFVSSNVYAMLLFVILQYSIRTRGQVRYLVSVLFGLALVNAAVAILQWGGVSQAWSLFEMLRPEAFARRDDASYREKVAFGYTPGLQSFSVPLSYILLLGLLSWGRLMATLSNLFQPSFLAQFFSFCLVELGIIVSLSRSSLYVFNALCVGTFFLYGTHFFKRTPVATRLLALGFACLVATLLLVHVPESSLTSIEGYSTDRLFQLMADERVMLATSALEAIAAHPSFGPGIEVYGDILGESMSPHSFFLNAGLLGGVPGILLMTSLSLTLYVVCRRGLKVSFRDPQPDTLTFGLVLVVVGYFLKSLFHNDSFATGGILGWVLVGVLVADLRTLKTQEERARGVGSHLRADHRYSRAPSSLVG